MELNLGRFLLNKRAWLDTTQSEIFVFEIHEPVTLQKDDYEKSRAFFCNEPFAHPMYSYSMSSANHK